MGEKQAVTREEMASVEEDGAVGASDAEAIARRVVELLRDSLTDASARESELVDAAELARRLGTGRSWVYAHAGELGAVRLGDGVRPRLRFDAGVALRRMRPTAQVDNETLPPGPRLRSRARRSETHLLPIKHGGAS